MMIIIIHHCNDASINNGTLSLPPWSDLISISCCQQKFLVTVWLFTLRCCRAQSNDWDKWTMALNCKPGLNQLCQDMGYLSSIGHKMGWEHSSYFGFCEMPLDNVFSPTPLGPQFQHNWNNYQHDFSVVVHTGSWIFRQCTKNLVMEICLSWFKESSHPAAKPVSLHAAFPHSTQSQFVLYFCWERLAMEHLSQSTLCHSSMCLVGYKFGEIWPLPLLLLCLCRWISTTASPPTVLSKNWQQFGS